eukprot:3055681-Prymnesium_polylepis.1
MPSGAPAWMTAIHVVRASSGPNSSTHTGKYTAGTACRKPIRKRNVSSTFFDDPVAEPNMQVANVLRKSET